jgi:acyl-CoA dehydrogenase
MDFHFSDEIIELTKTIRRFVENEVDPLSFQMDQEERIPQYLIDQMKDLGFFGLAIPEVYGGIGLSILDQCLVYEELGRTNACIRTYIGSNNGPGVGCICQDGTEAQKQKYLPGLARGEKISAFAVSEADCGSDLKGIRTTARKEGSNYILNGNKFYITMGDLADLVVVLAYTDKDLGAQNGMTVFLVERGFQGFSLGAVDKKMGLRGSNTCELIFEDCQVPRENIVGKVGTGFRVALKGINRGRVTIAAVSIGAASKLLDLSLAYSKQRQVSGQPISQFQAIQFKLADMATEIYAARNMLYHAACLADQNHPYVKEAAMVKLFATEMANRVAYEALQIFGGMGYMKELGVERMCRDVRVLTIYEGTSEIQRATIAAQLLRQ